MLKNSRTLARLRHDYFCEPSRRLHVAKGSILIEEGAYNDRLFHVISGVFSGTIRGEDDFGDEEMVELFRSGPGDFIGVVSFFSQSETAFMRITALMDAEVAWIDLTTPPVNGKELGSVRKQFLPVILQELVERQISLSKAAHERESALRRLHLSENLSTLGRLAAGIAHELNNAVGVLSRTADHLQHALESMLRKNHPENIEWFERGASDGQEHSSETVRRRGRELAKAFNLPYEKAKNLARIVGDAPIAELPENLDNALELWETGRACHDMQLAVYHASGIVKSVRDLGNSSQQRGDGTDVNKTLREAAALLKSYLRKVNVTYLLAPDLPPIWGNDTELAQIWINILRNACEAFGEAKTPSPTIRIETRAHRRAVEVVIANNGPRIAEDMLRRLFLPHITTKGGAMGMGLGLYIVKRLVDSYSGELFVNSDDELTRFSIHLPLHHEELDIDS